MNRYFRMLDQLVLRGLVKKRVDEHRRQDRDDPGATQRPGWRTGTALISAVPVGVLHDAHDRSS